MKTKSIIAFVLLAITLIISITPCVFWEGYITPDSSEPYISFRDTDHFRTFGFFGYREPRFLTTLVFVLLLFSLLAFGICAFSKNNTSCVSGNKEYKLWNLLTLSSVIAFPLYILVQFDTGTCKNYEDCLTFKGEVEYGWWHYHPHWGSYILLFCIFAVFVLRYNGSQGRNKGNRTTCKKS